MTRELSLAAVAVVDTAAAAALAGEAPGRVLSIVEAKIIEADPAAHAGEGRGREAPPVRVADPDRRDRAAPRHRPGHRRATRRTSTPCVSRVADILAGRPEHADAPRDLLRSLAFGWLARPAELLRLLLEHTDPEPAADPSPRRTPSTPTPARAGARRRARAGPGPGRGPAPSAGTGLPRRPPRRPEPDQPRPTPAPGGPLRAPARGRPHRRHGPRTMLRTVRGRPGAGVARVEGLGPHSLTQLTELLGHTRVAVQPVIDLSDQVSVNRYEHPTRVKERIHLRHPADVFPHASRVSRKVDLDHRIAYRAQGPPGQTGTRNGQPLGRTGHRAKTHLGYRCIAIASGGTLWRSPARTPPTRRRARHPPPRPGRGRRPHRTRSRPARARPPHHQAPRPTDLNEPVGARGRPRTSRPIAGGPGHGPATRRTRLPGRRHHLRGQRRSRRVVPCDRPSTPAIARNPISPTSVMFGASPDPGDHGLYRRFMALVRCSCVVELVRAPTGASRWTSRCSTRSAGTSYTAWAPTVDGERTGHPAE